MNKLLLLLLLAASTYCRAQVSAYSFAATADTFIELSGSTVVPNLAADSGTSAPISIGFDFTFNGISYNKVAAVSDGFLSFNMAATCVPTNNLTSCAANLRPLLAPVWDDLAGRANYSQFSYLTTGNPGSRIFTAEWKKWLWNRQSGQSGVSFQVKLYEGTNKVAFVYRPESYGVYSGSASIGIAGASTGTGSFLSVGNVWANPVVSSATETTTIYTAPDRIRVYSFTPSVPPATDLAIASVSTLSGETCPTTSLPASVTITNGGTNPIDFSATNATVRAVISGPVSQTLLATLTSGTLAPGAAQVVSLSPAANIAANGTYRWYWAANIANDGNRSNDTLITNTTTAATTAPWAEGFGTGANTTILPAGWKNTSYWSVGTYFSGSIYGNPGNCLYKNFISATDTGSFTTISVGPVAATDRLSFDYRVFAIGNGINRVPTPGWGNFRVLLSSDCGNTFTLIDSVTTTGTGEGWDFRAYPLAAYAGQYITLKIIPQWKATYWYLAFDNFKIKPPSAIDLASDGTRPLVSSCPNSTIPMEVLVRNDGTDPIDFATNNAMLTTSVTGMVTQTLTSTIKTGTLAPGASQWLPVSATGNLSLRGSYTFQSWVTVAGDGDRSNDTTSTSWATFLQVNPVPWAEPFTTTDLPGGWSTDGWNINTYTVPGNPGNALSKAFYSSSTSGSFATAPVGRIGAGQYLKFDYKLINISPPYVMPAAGWGKIRILIKRNCGATTTLIDSITTAVEGWNSRLIDLSAWAGDYITFSVEVSRNTGDWYLAFDNFRVYSPPAVDLAATQLTTPTSRCPNPTAPVSFSFKNLGTNTIDFAATPATITVNITGPTPQTLSATINSGTLAPLGSQTVAILPGANLSSAGSYSLKGFIAVSGDTTRSNDTATAAATIATIVNKPAPWIESFESGPNVPGGWEVFGWTVGSPRGVSGNPGNSLYQQISGGGSSNPIGILTVGPLPANSSFSFDYKIANPSPPYAAVTSNFGSIVVRLVTDCGATSTNLETITTAASGWSTKTYSLAAYAGKQVSITLLTYGVSTALDFGYDNFRIYTIQPADLSLEMVYATDNFCPAASVQSYVMVKNNGSGTVDFSSTPLNATIQITGPIPQTLNASLSSGSLAPDGIGGLLFPTFANLSAIGTYQYKGYISSVVDSNRVNDTLYITRTTGTASPWVETFTDTIASPMILPYNWLIGSVRGIAGNSGNSIYYNLRSDTGGSFSTRAIGPIASSDYLRFDYKLSNTTAPYNPPAAGWGYFKVQVSTNCGSTFTTLDSITTAPAGWTTKSYSLAAYAGQNIRLQIEPHWKAGDYDLAFDNLKVGSLTTSCAAPTGGSTSLRTDSSARVTFTGSGNSFIVEYGPYGFTPGTGNGTGTGGTVIAATSSPVNIRGLIENTGYTFYLRQNCTAAGNGFSANRLIDSFTTAPAPQAPMTNDLPANAIVLNVGAGCTGSRYTINGATQSSGEPAVSCAGSLTGGKIVWFKFAAPVNGFVKVSTDATANTLRDTKAALFSATDSSLFSTFQVIACDDDNGVLSDGASIFYATGLIPGRNYYVAVDGFNAIDTGRFCIAVSAADSSMIAASGSCIGGQPLVEQLPAYRGWLSTTNYSGQLIANLRSNTTLPGLASYYSFVNINTDSVRKAATAEYYLDRNFSFVNNFPTTAGNWEVQFFFLNKEMRALQVVSPTATLTNLNVTRGKDSLCRSSFLNGSADSLLLQNASGTTSGVSWITVPTTKLAGFYLNPGSSALPRLYVFTGSGMWSNPANWNNGLVPPAMLPPNSAIEIKPAPGGQCILDVNQRISDGDRLRIMSGTNVVIPGSVIIQQ